MATAIILKDLIEVLGTNTHQFEQAIGVGASTIAKAIKRNSEIKLDIVEKILSKFPTVSNNWLRTGEGPIFIEEKTPEPHNNPNARKVRILGEAVAGTDMEMAYHDTGLDEQYIDVGDLLRDSEAAFTVYGNSMTPSYPSGCVLGIRRNFDNFIQPGETYLLVTKSNRVFKRLYYTDDKSGFVCYSDNTQKFDIGPMAGKYFYPPFDVNLADVLVVYDIVGMIKRNRNSGIIQRQK